MTTDGLVFELAGFSEPMELVFQLMVLLALVVWAVWLVAPKSAVAMRLAREPLVFVGFGLIYVALLIVAILDGLPEGAGFTSVDGIMRVFDSSYATVAGWAHYLAFDLFAGAYIMRDSGGTYRVAVPLVLTLVAGPLGLLVYLAGRRRFRDETRIGL